MKVFIFVVAGLLVKKIKKERNEKMNRKNIKRFIAYLMIAVFLMGLMPERVLASGVKTYTYEEDNYIVEYQIAENWSGAYKANVTINNIGNEELHNWSLSLTVDGEINNIWNAKIDSQNGSCYTISGNNYNQKIEVGKSVDFGIIVQSDSTDKPDIQFVVSKKLTVNSEEYSVDYSVSSDWGTGFTGQFEIINKSSECLKEWYMELDWDNNTDNIWNANLVLHEGNHYVISCESYNQNIEPGCKVQFGFSCSSGNSSSRPENIILSHYKAGNTGNGSVIPVEDDEYVESEIDISLIEDYAYIEYKEGNCAESVVDDVKFVNLAPDVLDIGWSTSDKSVIRDDGTIIRGDEDKKAVIKAVIKYDGTVYEKEYELTVKRKGDINADKLTDFSLSQLENMNKDDEYYETEVNDFRYIESIYGKYSDVKVDSYETALMSLYNVKSALGITNPFSELQIRDVKCDETGYIFKFDHVYNGMKVFGNSVTVSADEDGNTDFLNSEYYPIENEIETIPVYSRESAVEKLELEGYSDIGSEDENLMVFNYYGKCTIVWEFMCRESSSGDEFEVLFDARTGEIDYLNKISDELIRTVETSGKDLLNDTRKFSVKESSMNWFYETLEGPFYDLEDKERKIRICDAQGTSNPLKDSVIRNENNIWSETEVSAMANMEEVYDFYKDKVGRISYDGALSQLTGNVIKVYVNTDVIENAYWSPTYKCIFLGQGTGATFKKCSLGIEKDTLAHEFTHGVVQDETSLDIYCGLPGAINEAYADIFACYFEGDWIVGEAATVKPCLRNIKNPYDTEDPVKVGGKYYKDIRKFDRRHDFGGVHSNSVIVSHVAYEMEKKDISKSVMKIWYKSLCLGYKKHSDFYDVRKNVIKAAKKLKCSSDDLKKIEECFDNANITKETCDETYESYFKELDEYIIVSSSLTEDSIQILGKVVEADKDFDYSNNKNIQSAVIKSKSGYAIGNTDINGNYTINHEEDNPIELNFSKDGYIDEKMYISQVNALRQDKYYSDIVELIPNSEKGMGKASGYIKDSVTGKGIEGLKIEIRSGINNIYTDVLYEIDTQKNGYYITPQLEAGNYCLEIYDYKNDYISSSFNVKIFGNETFAEQNMSISNSLKKNQMRAVLTWGEKPRDLDAIISFNLSDGSSGHVSLGRAYSIDGVCISKSDIDDVNGYGPETITIYNDKTGEYTYYVYNFSEEIEMKNGGNVMVKVYFGNNTMPSYTFSMPYQSGRIWTVFKYNSSTGRISVINEVGNSFK